MKVKFLEPAYLEYQQSIEFYNLQTQGLGDRFIHEIDLTISLIKKFPDSFPKYTENTRRAAVNIFPYNIIYTLENNSIIIIAIAHQHRKPLYWSERS